MNTHVPPGESDYQDIHDGYSHYQQLSGEEQRNTDNRGHTNRRIEPMRIESMAGTDNDACCKKPPCWVWFVLVLFVLIMAGLAAGLVFLLLNFSDSSMQTAALTPNARVLRGANCQALYKAGYTTSGVHTVSPDGVNEMTVYCEQSLDRGGWTVFQRRFNGQVSFDRKWAEYREGFGDVAGEHWLGNDNIHILTAAANQKLKIEMTHPDGTRAYADYRVFWIENEMNKYRLHVSGFVYRSPPGDALSLHDGFAFTTLDRDNDIEPDWNCAEGHNGGWWFTKCHPSNLNGLYNAVEWDGIIWYPWTSGNQSLVNVRMMVKTA